MPDGDDPSDYPGARLGLPPAGPGSLATWRTRFTGLVLDWALSMLLAALFFGTAAINGDGWRQFMVPVVFLVHTTLLITFAGASAGQLACRIGVARLDSAPIGIGRALGRQLLVSVVLPALVLDGQRRGLQDLALGTVVAVRRRAAAPA